MSRRKWIMCHEDRHPLLLEYFLTSIRCIRMVGRASDSIYDPLMVNPVLVFYQTYALIPSKITNVGHRISPGYVTLCCKDRYLLLLECFLTSLRCVRTIGRAFDSISDSLLVNTACFLPNGCTKFKQDNQFWAPDQPRKCDTVS